MFEEGPGHRRVHRRAKESGREGAGAEESKGEQRRAGGRVATKERKKGRRIATDSKGESWGRGGGNGEQRRAKEGSTEGPGVTESRGELGQAKES